MTPAEARGASEDAYYLRSLLVLLLVGFVPEVYDGIMSKQMGISRSGSGRALASTVRMVVQSNPQFVTPAGQQEEEITSEDQHTTDGSGTSIPAAQPAHGAAADSNPPGVSQPDGGEGPGEPAGPDATDSQC